jgi:nitroreductase
VDIIEAVKQRRSIRAYKPDPVPDDVLREIMELALRAPSGSNVQPWECFVVQGKKLDEIKKVFTEKATELPNFDFYMPFQYPEPYNTRRKGVLKGLMAIKGIEREDKEKRMQFTMDGNRMWGAPAVVYICTDASIYRQGEDVNVWPLFDCGLLAENIMLLATAHGLGTAPLIQAAIYADEVRRIVGIPESKLIMLGIAIGYADVTDPVNSFRSERAPMDEVVTWC